LRSNEEYTLLAKLIRGHTIMARSIVRFFAVQLSGMFCALCWAAAPALAADPSAANRLPEETVAYLRIQNTSELVERLEQTALGLAFQDPQVRPLVEHLWSSVVPTLERFEEQMGVGLDEVAKAAPGQLVVALVSVPEMPAAGVIMFRPLSPDALDKTLERGGGRLQELGFTPSSDSVDGAQLSILTREEGPFEELIQLRLDDWRIITTDRAVAAAIVGLWRGEAIPRLSDHPPFRTIMTRCASEGSSSQVDWFVDPIGTARAVTRGNLGAAAAMAMLPALGADGFRAIGGRVTVADENYDIIFRTHLLLEPPRDGVLKLLALQQGSSDPEPWVPADAASYVTWQLDIQKVYASLQEVVDGLRGEGALARMVDQRLSERLGVDVQEEVLPLLAGRITQIVRFERPASPTSQTNAIGVELTDGAKFRAPLAQVVEKFSGSIETSTFAGVDIYQWTGGASSSESQSPRAGGNAQEGAELTTGRPQPVAAILGKYFVVADRLSLMQQMIMTSDEAAPRLGDELDFKLIVGKLNRQSTTGPSMIRFERPDEGLRYLYQMLQTDELRQKIHEQRERHPFFQALDEMLTEKRLPPFEVFGQFLAPSGSMLVNEESGFHHVSFGLRRHIEPSLGIRAQ
jgi:hypothetical protein